MASFPDSAQYAPGAQDAAVGETVTILHITYKGQPQSCVRPTNRKGDSYQSKLQMAHRRSFESLALETTSPIPEPRQYRITKKSVPGLTLSEADHVPDGSLMSEKLSTPQESKASSFFQIWWLVITCCAVATAMVFAIVSILYTSQNRPLPNFPYRISINTLISILVTIMKACMLVTLAEGLGQLKWEYFRKRRPLHHLAAYDSATRGPWGCVELILLLRNRSFVATLGAGITILALPIEAFTQQLVHYSPCKVPATNGSMSTIPRANLYTETAGLVGSGIFNPTTDQIGAMVSALFSPSLVRLPFVCSTGDCSFNGSYATLAYSAECQDVTDELHVFWQDPRNQSEVDPPSASNTGAVLNSALPSGLWAGGRVGTPIFSMSADRDDVDTTALVVEMILGAQELGENSGFNTGYGALYGTGCDSDWQNQTWGCIGKGAARCTIKPSVQVYTASVEAGVLKEELVETCSDWYTGQELQWTGQELQSTGRNYSAMVDLSCVNDTTKDILRQRGLNVPGGRFTPYDVVISAAALGSNDEMAGNYSQISNEQASDTKQLTPEQLSLIPKACVYEMPDFALISFQRFLGQYLSVQVTPSLIGMAPSLAGSLEGESQALTILNNTQLDISTINKTFNALAQAISVRMRQWNSSDTRDLNRAEVGTANVSTTCVTVQWPWITYVAAVVISTVVFFIVVVIQTEILEKSRFARGWLNSVLPLIYHGVDDVVTDERNDSNDKDDIKIMSTSAKRSTGYIVKRSEGGRAEELQPLRDQD